MVRLPGVAGGLVLAISSIACGSDPCTSYLEVDRVFAREPEFFAEFWQRGFTEHLRIAVFGDSQETSPEGAGSAYIPNINRRLHDYYGHSGETILMTHKSVGGGLPPAGWLWRGGLAAPNGTASILQADELPPNIAARAHRQKSPATQSYGLLAMLLYDGSLTSDPELPVQPYFSIDNPIAVEILAVTAPGSGGISYRILPNSVNVGNYFATPTGAGVLTPKLDVEATEVVAVCTPAIELAGLPYAQVEVWGSSLEAPTQILGVRYVDLAEHRGVTVQSIAAGGYRTHSFLTHHANSGPVVRGMGFDLVLIHTGCNDAGGGRTAEEYQQALMELIAWIRGSVGDPNLPVVIVGDVHRSDWPPQIQQEYDRYPWAARQVAESDHRVMAVNLRRITEEDLGWGPDDTSFLADLVHLTTAGQRELARVLVETLTGFGPNRRHPADVDGNGVVDGSDVSMLIAAWGTPHSPLDLTGDREVDGADLAVVIGAWGWQYDRD
jgi:lysophospholipase L1-like esterase